MNRATACNFQPFRPLSRARPFYWDINLGLAPQALCLRLLSQARTSFDFDFLCKAFCKCLRLLSQARNIIRFRLFVQSLLQPLVSGISELLLTEFLLQVVHLCE